MSESEMFNQCLAADGYVMVNVPSMLCVCTQDIRRFFAPTSAKPVVQKPARNGNMKTEEAKKNPLSSEEKKNKKETAKARK